MELVNNGSQMVEKFMNDKEILLVSECNWKMVDDNWSTFEYLVSWWYEESPRWHVTKPTNRVNLNRKKHLKKHKNMHNQ